MQYAETRNLLGKTFGLLTIVEVIETINNNRSSFKIKCQCKCGNYSYPKISALLGGGTKSCGCLRKDKWRKAYYAFVKEQEKFYRS